MLESWVLSPICRVSLQPSPHSSPTPPPPTPPHPGAAPSLACWVGLGFVHSVGPGWVGSQHSLCNSQDPGCPGLLHLGVLGESGEGTLGVPCVEEPGVGGRSSEGAGLDSEFRSFTHTVKAIRGRMRSLNWEGCSWVTSLIEEI